MSSSRHLLSLVSCPVVAFRDIPAAWYPFRVRAIDAGGCVVWEARMDGPGALVIPPLAQEHGPVGIEVEFPDGRIEWQEPPRRA